MTLIAQDPRRIANESPLYNATLVDRIDESDRLARFRVRLDGQPPPFVPGQYMTLGLEADGQLIQRPYSSASAAQDVADGLEFYVRLVPVLRFTTLLWRTPVGHGMRMAGPKGRFVLEEDDARTHLFIATGTGIAPFISMMRTVLAEGRARRSVVVHGVSYASELGFRDLLEGWSADGTYPLTYVPTVSRPDDPRNAGWSGHSGRVEKVIGGVCEELALDPERTVAYLCGNPEMVVNTERVLLDRGFRASHVKHELYWPQEKQPGSSPAPARPVALARPLTLTRPLTVSRPART